MAFPPPDPFRSLDMLDGLLTRIQRTLGHGFNRQTVNDLQCVDQFIPQSTIHFFFDFAFEGNLPTGGKSRQSLLHENEVPLFSQPYSTWAPAPYNQSPSDAQSRVFGNHLRPNPHAVTVQRRISCMRARLWHGMVPMTGQRWKEKKLDDPDNWQFAMDFMFDIMYTFLWLGDPEVTKGIKNQFNYISKELETYQAALNVRRAQRGIATTINLTGLWLEWMHAVFETMVTRTHSWCVDRVNETVSKAKAKYDVIAERDGEANSREAAKKMLEPWADMNNFLGKADFLIMMPMDGFQGFSESCQFSSTVAGSMFPMPFRRDQQDDMKAAVSWPVAERLMDDVDGIYKSKSDIEALIQESDDQNGEIRKAIRGEPRTLGPEHWITIIKSRTEWSLTHGGPQDQTWGFVCYNLTHKPNEEWARFLVKLHSDFRGAGEWVEGFEDVRQNMGLQWVDGRTNSLPRNGIAAAKRHFMSFRNASECRRRAWKFDFLVVDDESFESYMNPPVAFQNRAPYGDHGGYLKVIDTMQYNPEVLREQSPGYDHQLKILGSLVFDDFYPLIVGLAQRPMDLWTYAMMHPNQVYVGPSVKPQEEDWDKIWRMRKIGLQTFIRWRREQQT